MLIVNNKKYTIVEAANNETQRGQLGAMSLLSFRIHEYKNNHTIHTQTLVRGV